MKNFSPRDLVAGALLVVLVVAVAVFVDSDRPVFEDEAIVLAAISAVAPAEENCDISYGLNSDDLGRYPHQDHTFGVTWGLPHADDSIERVVIECTVWDDVDGPDWDRSGMWFDFDLRYPLKSGKHAEAINEQVRNEVASIVSLYLADARSGNANYSGEPDESTARKGWLSTYGFASFMNEGIYSAHMQTSPHLPGANTSPNYLGVWNYDLTTGEQFFLPDLLYPGETSHSAILNLIIEAYNGGTDYEVRYEPGEPIFLNNPVRKWPLSLDPEDLRDQQFVLTADALVLDCIKYCDSGIARALMFNTSAYEIPYKSISEHLNPDGPYRLILNN